MSFLDKINPGDSGLSSFNREEFKQKLLERELNQGELNYPYHILSLFIFEKFEELEKLLQEDPSLVGSIEIKALKLLNNLYLNKEVSNKDLFPFSSPELSMKRKIAKRVSKEILRVYDVISQNLSSFQKNPEWQKIDFWELSQALPEMRFEYARYLLENNIQKQFSKVITEIENIEPTRIENPEIAKEVEIEKKYLEAFYYRRIKDQTKAEQASLDYYELYKPDPDQSSNVISQGNKDFYPAEQVLESWDKVLKEADKIQREIETQAGLLETTCDYFKCSDCCSNTFPSMTLTEYKHLLSWIKKNNYPIENIIEEAKKIQADHKAKYGTELQVVNKEDPKYSHRGSENPHSYKFSCPFLKDHKCSIYEARPLLCRGFGLSSDNDFSLKTCKYYLAQYRHLASPENERYSYDLRPAQMLAASSDRFLTKGNLRVNSGGKHLVGTLVAWLTNEPGD